MKTNPYSHHPPALASAKPALVVFQKPLENAMKYLFRHSGRYGFEPRQNPAIAGYMENNTLYLALNPARHIVFSLNRGAEPRVKLDGLEMEKIMHPDAFVWVSKNNGAPDLAENAEGARPFISSSRLHARMREIRLKTNRETSGTACNVLVSQEFSREFASLSLEIVQFRV